MKTHRENFKAWYVDILEGLYPIRDAGFVILMIAFPLLERYLRQKLQLPPQASLHDNFYDELTKVFSQLPDLPTARNFWQVYRNGILHEVTLSNQNRSGRQMPIGSLSHEKPEVSIDPNGRFWINPVLFSKRVVQIIEADFSVYEGKTAAQSPLPKAKTITSSKGRIILGTNTEQ